MEIRAIWAVIVRRWWLILIPTLVALVISLPTLRSIVSPPVSYTTTIRFTASARPCASGTFQDCAYTPWLQSEYVVTNLASWVQTESFAREVAAQLPGGSNAFATIDQIRAIIHADSARSILSLNLGGWPDATQLTQIGRVSAAVLQTKAANYLPQIEANTFAVVALDNVQVVASVPPLGTRLTPLARIGIGLALGVVLAFAIDYFDRSVRSRAEVESLGLSVIAEIPGNA